MSWVRHKHCLSVRPSRGRLGKHRERLSLQAHLAWCELKLRLKTKPGQLARRRLLDLLHSYWRAGRFPQNPRRTTGRQSIFIDDHGTHCAVGYLMAQTGADSLAKEINQRDRFAYLETVDLNREPKIKQWLADNELEPDEVALIQPSYPGWSIFGPSEAHYTHTGMSGGDIVIAIISIVFSLLLLLPTVTLIFLSKKTLVDKILLFLRGFGGIVLFVIILSNILPVDSSTGRSVVAIANMLVWVLLTGLILTWLWRWRQGRPMFGFDESQQRYRLWSRLLLYALGAILVAGAGYGLVLPDYFVYLNLLALVSLPLLLAHRPLQSLKPQLRKSITGGFMISVVILAFVIPSPIYTADQLARGGSRTYCNSSDPSFSCWEITRSLPKLIQPDTWRESSFDLD